jgi:hypothetical protein
MRAVHVFLEDYEEQDISWWCLHHKSTLSHVCIRLEQYMALDNDEERATLEPILQVLLDNLHDKGIGLTESQEGDSV